MTWPAFFKWLTDNGFKYTRGDIHYAGSGYWYPQLPDITTGHEDPRPPEPYVHVAEDKANKAVFVDRRGRTPRSTYAEDPERARVAVDAELMVVFRELDDSLGSFDGLADSALEDMLIEAGFTEHGAFWGLDWDDTSITVRLLGDEARISWVGGQEETLEEASFELPEFEVDAIRELTRLMDAADYFDEHHRKPPHGRSFHGVEDEVSHSCDIGAHERCSGCGCGCHPQTAFKTCTQCKKEFTQEEWDELPLLKDKKGRPNTNPSETVNDGVLYRVTQKNCPCGGTMAIEEAFDLHG